MGYMYRKYPGIVKVEFFDLDSLDSDCPDLNALSGSFPRMPEKSFEIPIIGSGEADVIYANGAESCTLTFSSDERIRPGFRPGFIFTDANGDAFMVASASKPFPKMEIARSFGKWPGERPRYNYTIKHSSLMAAIPLLS